jgi:hypothetical protein
MEGLFSRRAYRHIKFLSEEIGPRPAGSEKLTAAQQYCRDLLEGWGYTVANQSFVFSRRPWMGFLGSAAGMLLVLGSWGFSGVPGLIIWLPLIGAVLPEISRWLMTRGACRERGSNLTASAETNISEQTLVLCAHLDSAPALPFRSSLLIWFQRRWLTVYQRWAVGLGFLSLFSLLDFLLLPWMRLTIAGLGSLIGGCLIVSGTWQAVRHGRRWSPGANDNASGVGLLLALAEHFQKQPCHNLRLLFVFFDAEEPGLDGARAQSQTLPPDSHRVINLDMVGAGDQLRYVTRDGTIFPLKTDDHLNQLIASACPQAKPLINTRRSGDYRPFLRQGIPAASLEVTGSAAARRAYHTVKDSLDLVDRQALQQTAEALINVVAALNEEASKRPE